GLEDASQAPARDLASNDVTVAMNNRRLSRRRCGCVHGRFLRNRLFGSRPTGWPRRLRGADRRGETVLAERTASDALVSVFHGRSHLDPFLLAVRAARMIYAARKVGENMWGAKPVGVAGHRKLSLNRETLRVLAQANLAQVAGGSGPSDFCSAGC